MSSFFSSEIKKKVEQRSVSFAAQNGLSFTENNKIVIDVDDSVNYFSGNESFLKFNVKITNANEFVCQMDPFIGANVLFDTLRIFTRDNILLEEITNYNALVNIKYMYDNDSSINKKRGMTEGVVLHDLNQMSWNGSEKSRETNSLSNPWIDNDGAGNLKQKDNVSITLPIHSGIFSNSVVFPNRLMGGIRIELTCAQNKYCFKGLRNALNDTYSPTLSHVAAGAIGTGWTAATATNKIFLQYTNNMMVDIGRLPFKIGETLKVGTDAGTQACIIGSVALVVVAFGGLNYNMIEITTTANHTSAAPQAAGVAVKSISLGDPTSEISYTISNVELIVEEVIVNDKKIESDMKQNGKMIYQCNSYQNYRQSVLATDTSATTMIHLLNSQAKSLLCAPIVGLNSTQKENLVQFGAQRNNLSGFFDTLESYQFFYGPDGQARLQPDRPVNSSKMSSALKIYDQDYCIELEKALAHGGIIPRSLNNALTNTVIGRVLAIGNQIMNVRNMDFQLNLNYTNPTANKMLNVFCYHVRTFEVSSGGVVVIM